MPSIYRRTGGPSNFFLEFSSLVLNPRFHDRVGCRYTQLGDRNAGRGADGGRVALAYAFHADTCNSSHTPSVVGERVRRFGDRRNVSVYRAAPLE